MVELVADPVVNFEGQGWGGKIQKVQK